MKDFNIENVERKNIYHLPENTFEKIQAGVFAQIKPVKKAPVFKMNWAIAAAASLAGIFGATFMFSNNDEKPAEKYVAVAEEKPVITVDNVAVEKSNYAPQINAETRIIEAETRTPAAAYVQINDKTRTANVKNTPSVNRKTAEQEMAEYLDTFTSSEIAEVANNSSQDVYLDLYN